MIKVYIIDDHQIVIDAVVRHLLDVSGVEVIGSSTSPVSGIESVQTMEPDVVLLDISMPEMNGIDCAQKILDYNPDQKIIMLSTHQEVSIIKKVMKVGVLGYVSKSSGISTIELAIQKVNRGEKYLGDNIAQAYMEELLNPNKKSSDLAVIPQLTKREDEVLKLIADEGTTQEISQQLHISTNTVETHRRNLISKFQVRNSVGLIRKAIELGLLK